jgi:hypothetical protein
MSETLAHTRLVGVIVNWVQAKYSTTPGFCLFCDCPTVLETEKPSPIEGFFPDVCALTTPSALTILGEAKTLPDLESSRSFQQLVAFLRFLAARPQPSLIIATPWQATATARNIIIHARLESRVKHVQLHFLTDQASPC